MRDIWLSIKDVGKGIVAFALRFGLVLMFFVLSGALVFYFLDEQRLTLTSPILPPHVMAAWCIAASILLFVHFSTQSRAFATIFGNSLHFQILRGADEDRPRLRRFSASNSEFAQSSIFAAGIYFDRP